MLKKDNKNTNKNTKKAGKFDNNTLNLKNH